MKNRKFVIELLKRAKSNLEEAKLGRISKDILYEGLCFDYQQCAEKSIKALLISRDKKFLSIHSIRKLLELVSEAGIEIKKSIKLTKYAVETRYPGKIEPVTQEEYKEALTLAEEVFKLLTKLL